MNGNRYKYLIFDIDDTLLDFGSAFFQARKNIAALIGVECTEEYNAMDEKTGWKAWNEMRMDDTEDPDVQKNYHKYSSNSSLYFPSSHTKLLLKYYITF